MGKGTDIKKPSTEPAYVTVMNKFIDGLRSDGKLIDRSAPEDALLDMVTRILNAQSDDEMAGGTVDVSTLVGRVIGITGVNFLPSTKRAGQYAIITYKEQDSETEEVTTCGSPRMVAQCINLADRKAIPSFWRVGSAAVSFVNDDGSEGTGDTFFLEKAR